MDLRFKLKEWLSLDDAAQFLSTITTESFSPKDLIELVLDGRIPIYWTLQNQLAHKVAPLTSLYPHIFTPPSADWLINRVEGYAKSIIAHVGEQDEDIAKHYQNFTGGGFELANPYSSGTPAEPRNPSTLNGRFEIQLWYSNAIVDHLTSFITEYGGDLISLEGHLVRDNDGQFWQLLEWRPGENATDEGMYVPVIRFPAQKQLTIQRCDLENLLNLNTSQANAPGNVPGYGAAMAPHWGDRLRKLIVLANKLWARDGLHKVDPTDESTFPFNSDVIEQIVELGYHPRIAKDLAILLRPDWGTPRVKKKLTPK